MSYIRADEILPRELLETIQQYAEGKLLYIPRKEKQKWGSATSAKAFYRERNRRIYEAHRAGVGVKELAQRFSLAEKSIHRILREQKLAAEAGDEAI